MVLLINSIDRPQIQNNLIKNKLDTLKKPHTQLNTKIFSAINQITTLISRPATPLVFTTKHSEIQKKLSTDKMPKC